MPENQESTQDKINNTENPVCECDNQDIIDELPEEIKNLPEKEKRSIMRMMFRSQSVISGGLHNPLIDKFEPEHIKQMLDLSENDSKREHEDRKEVRKFILILIIIALIFIIAVILLLKNNPELLTYIITAIVSLITGGIGGYGLGIKQKNN